MSAIQKANNRQLRGNLGQVEDQSPTYPLRSISLLVALFALAIASVYEGNIVPSFSAGSTTPAQEPIAMAEEFQFPDRR